VVAQLFGYVHFLTLLKLKHRKVSNWRGYRGIHPVNKVASQSLSSFFLLKKWLKYGERTNHKTGEHGGL